MPEFSEKTVMITGAAGNLGKAVASRFLAEGANLVLVDLSADRLGQVYSELEASRDRRLLIPADLTSEQGVSGMTQQAMATFGRIDVLANIAGGFTMGPPLHETPLIDWDFMMNLNARTMFLTSRAVIPQMLAQGGGKIVSVSARAARSVKSGMAPYCASKGSVITLTECLAVEHRHDNIKVNCVLPGTIDTPQNRNAMPDADFARWVSPEELANVILFLASEQSRAVSGASIPVYGES
ncbi:MAG: SDR family oxidoreductase [Gammaproteobacteria bacterium]|jgi:NAD(P)-dependent dehydrogenase (short-subunit alcohol dehydrogenase family)|nr:SDR family oxidoreductase [Gammaproteobacteria bacterium]